MRRIVRILIVLVVIAPAALVIPITANAYGCGYGGPLDHSGSYSVFDSSRNTWLVVYDDLYEYWQTEGNGHCERMYQLVLSTSDGSTTDHMYANIRVWVCGSYVGNWSNWNSGASHLGAATPYFDYGLNACGAQADDYGSYASRAGWSRTAYPYSSF